VDNLFNQPIVSEAQSLLKNDNFNSNRHESAKGLLYVMIEVYRDLIRHNDRLFTPLL